MHALFDILIFAAGYAVSIYSWPHIKVWVNGVTAEAASLRAKAVTLDSRIRSL